MNRYSHVLILLLSGLLSCKGLPPMDKRMVNQVITGEVNGVPFKTGMTVQWGASIKQDMCDQNVIGVSLVRKIDEKQCQIISMNYFHVRPGNYTLTDSAVRHRENAVCTLDSVSIGSYFKSEPGDDSPTDMYRLLEGPWNYLEVLYYDPQKREIQGRFAAKFVRVGEVRNKTAAVDTITYAHGKFILANINVQEVFTEPR